MRNPQNRPWMICGLFLCCLHLYLLLTTAWVADDAFITFRTIDHFLQGDGPRFNVQERVQTYTHPLWFLCLSFLSYFSGEIYYTTLFFSVSLAMTGLGMLVHGLAPKWEGRLLALGLVCFSKAYVEYSTSGLENPLSHILLAFFVWIWCKNKSSIWLFGTAGLLLLNRLDLGVLLAIPLSVHVDQHRSGKTVLAAMVGFLPLLLWELFSMVYYGFPFPNTAYAKLFSTGLSRWELVQQGGFYLLNGLWVDPVTIVGIGLGVGFALGDRNMKTWPLA
ncbi:MAG: hypothetical protein RBU29_02360, partial [bacterium]|nr:hypothetical protein [bacterium]